MVRKVPQQKGVQGGSNNLCQISQNQSKSTNYTWIFIKNNTFTKSNLKSDTIKFMKLQILTWCSSHTYQQLKAITDPILVDLVVEKDLDLWLSFCIQLKTIIGSDLSYKQNSTKSTPWLYLSPYVEEAWKFIMTYKNDYGKCDFKFSMTWTMSQDMFMFKEKHNNNNSQCQKAHLITRHSTDI